MWEAAKTPTRGCGGIIMGIIDSQKDIVLGK